MNKFQKEVLQSQLNDEKYVIKLLKKVYEQARKDCEQKIRNLSSRTDLENLQSIIYQKQYQKALKKQLDGILDSLQSEEFTSIADYLQKCYENGYIGVMYDLHQQGIPIIMPINQEQVVKALQTDSKLSQGLYSRLGEDTDYLKRSIRAELSRGIANGSTWNEIAGHIANGMNSPFNRAFNNAIRISRTEGHRIQQRSALDAQYAAREKGADILKQWDSTLDNRTRPHHRRLDGQIRELDEDFEVDGMTAPYPGGFGDPAEDCNCRCCILQRARWALDQDELNELKERAAYFGLDKTKDFEDYRSKYMKAMQEADAIVYKEPEHADYVRIMHGSQKAVSVDDKMQIAKHTKADGSPGGYVATHNYSNINSNMRNDGWTGNQLDDDDFKTIEAMRRAISQYELDDNLIMTRYVNADYLTSVFGIKTKTWSKGQLESISNSITSMGNPYVVKEGIPQITKDLQAKIGTCITEKSFLSTSVLPQKNIMKDKAVLFKICAKKGTHCYIPVNRKESECIFADDSKLFIKDVQYDDTKKWIITVDIE